MKVKVIILLMVGIATAILWRFNETHKGSRFQPDIQIPIIIRVTDEETLKYWNGHAKLNDGASGQEKFLNYLTKSTAREKILVWDKLEDTDKIINLAKSNSINNIAFNRENINDCQQLLDEETTVANLAKTSNLGFIFAPTGRMIEKCLAITPNIFKTSNNIVYQTQGFQTDDNYSQRVGEIIKKIKEINPDIKVIVQVSVNPPANRQDSFSQVVLAVKSIENDVDAIQIFYTPGKSDRVDAMQQVIDNLRQ